MGTDDWTGGHDEINRHFSLRTRTCLKSITTGRNLTLVSAEKSSILDISATCLVYLPFTDLAVG